MICWRCVHDVLALCTCVGVVYMICWRCVHDVMALCTCVGVVYVMCSRCVHMLLTLSTSPQRQQCGGSQQSAGG